MNNVATQKKRQMNATIYQMVKNIFTNEIETRHQGSGHQNNFGLINLHSILTNSRLEAFLTTLLENKHTGLDNYLKCMD